MGETRSVATTRITKLLARIPGADGTYRAPGLRILVYRAKPMGSRTWRGGVLKKLIREARKSFLRYGNRPIFDAYDRKAAIYIARAHYFLRKAGKRRPVEEWLTLRVVPGEGKPKGWSELEIFSFRGESLDRLIKRKVFGGNKDFAKYIVSSSRMGGIPPFYVRPRDEIKYGKTLSPKHKHTVLCYAAMHRQFMREYGGLPYRYLTDIIRNDFYRKALTLKRKGRSYRHTLTPAYKVFGAPFRGHIAVDRTRYAYRYPLYWLDMTQMRLLLRALAAKKDLTDRSLTRFLRLPRPYHLAEKIDDSFAVFRHLGNLLTIKGKIRGSRLSGEQLRRLVDKNVRDVPELKITKRGVWEKSITRLLEAAGLKYSRAPAPPPDGFVPSFLR